MASGALRLHIRSSKAVKQFLGRCFASKPPAQGDTLRPEGRRGAEEIAGGTKGTELATNDALKNVTITDAAQAFKGDLRSTSALGLGDGLYSHTDKWYQVLTNHCHDLSSLWCTLLHVCQLAGACDNDDVPLNAFSSAMKSG